MVSDSPDGDRTATTRRLRKIQTLRPDVPRRLEPSSDDLPVFLANFDWRAAAAERAPRKPFDFRNRLQGLSARATGTFAAQRANVEEGLRSLQQRAKALPLLVQHQNRRDLLVRGALVALIAPLAVLAVQDQPRRPAEVAKSIAPAPSPKFNLEDRLAFTPGLRDHVPSHEIAERLKEAPSEPSPPVKQAENAPPTASAPEQPHVEIMPDSTPPPLAPVALDDRKWSLPFGSSDYVPAELPTTAAASFRSEIAMTEVMNARVTSAYEVPVAKVASIPPVKRTATKRYKVIAQKKRPAKANEMTAAAAPVPMVTPKQPNLPPPPILFFLGAPPPQQP